MGKIKYVQKIRSFFKKNIIVDINSLKKFIQKDKGNKEYIYLLMNNMIRRKEIKRITKGYYSIHEDPILAVFCFKPSYIGLQAALGIHDVWEQETIPVILTTKKIRQGIRKVNEDNIMLHRISSKYFFGIEYIKEGEVYIPVSDLEKTFIDMVYFRQRIDRNLLKEFKRKIDMKRLNNYAKKYPKIVFSKIMNELR